MLPSHWLRTLIIRPKPAGGRVGSMSVCRRCCIMHVISTAAADSSTLLLLIDSVRIVRFHTSTSSAPSRAPQCPKYDVTNYNSNCDVIASAVNFLSRVDDVTWTAFEGELQSGSLRAGSGKHGDNARRFSSFVKQTTPQTTSSSSIASRKRRTLQTQPFVPQRITHARSIHIHVHDCTEATPLSDSFRHPMCSTHIMWRSDNRISFKRLFFLEIIQLSLFSWKKMTSICEKLSVIRSRTRDGRNKVAIAEELAANLLCVSSFEQLIDLMVWH